MSDDTALRGEVSHFPDPNEQLSEQVLASAIASALNRHSLDTTHPEHLVAVHRDGHNPGDLLVDVTRPCGIVDEYRVRVFAQ